MRRALFTLAATGTVLSLLYLWEGTRYKLGTPAEPGPGMFPLLISVILLLGFIGTGIEALASSEIKVKIDWPAGSARRRVSAIAASCIAYWLALPYAGQMIAGSLLAFAVLHVMALRSWPVKIVLSLLIGVGSYVLFGVILGVPFPTGILFG
jgi:putative tricarboxylic transport membrane protein